MDGVAVPGKKLMSLKTSKQTSTVASKIKNKILSKIKLVYNWECISVHVYDMLHAWCFMGCMLSSSDTSSFFKVSLKTNNKALALALVAQKEKSRQMEVENVHLQKQIEALYFDLAVRRHKHKKLVGYTYQVTPFLHWAQSNIDLVIAFALFTGPYLERFTPQHSG